MFACYSLNNILFDCPRKLGLGKEVIKAEKMTDTAQIWQRTRKVRKAMERTHLDRRDFLRLLAGAAAGTL